MKTKGTREWSDHSKNTHIGCPHNCRYCYARYNAVRRTLVNSNDEWEDVKRNKYSKKEMDKDHFKKLDGRIMYPTTHDITPDILPTAIEYLKGWLDAENEVLVTSKPHYDVINSLTDNLKDYKNQLTFRFTIGSMSEKCLNYWEPGAPSFTERFASLVAAHSKGYETSVSCEPLLTPGITKLVDAVEPYVSDTIWIGIMNDRNNRVIRDDSPEDTYYNHIVDKINKMTFIERVYNDLSSNDKIRWKDSIQEMLGLESEKG